jgi:hypothetical protein
MSNKIETLLQKIGLNVCIRQSIQSRRIVGRRVSDHPLDVVCIQKYDVVVYEHTHAIGGSSTEERDVFISRKSLRASVSA